MLGLKHYFLDTPLGLEARYIHICASDTGIRGVHFSDKKTHQEALTPLISSCIQALEGYFDGLVFSFDLPLEIQGTPFQERVWSILPQIPYGKTWSYKDLALQVGSIRYSRAVGGANHRNPIAIIIPCHRVIGSDGRLVGYAEGVGIKKWLLEHEQSFLPH
ncbi:cysteine methyltransferase [Helicobacter sp. 12S02634-8]|uniref:methylated-DNA--[protein]-cysteine S-methyltransferase n=1 Tax=Helicobacter sp. 12S02634-8 TaxID=1476199 RepID=UPI000BA5AD80|nr:methylated-DNA--[protein]-cysteine S-methyltransferase [Helicobacter sp. 12S02634-8]PAF48533.1 cysteine methyltransferase [Helicobacter sp. 12S02634-8]